MVALKEGRLSDALRLFQRALDYDRKAENTMGIVKDMLQIAEVYRQQGDTAMQRYYEQLVEQALDKNEIPR
jgi:tetratricopeptide (TPR) repeat protein